tara:strand:- start:161418 stop:161534 length:117 start_codon:yes stop_codon:yes gene_type:complete
MRFIVMLSMLQDDGAERFSDDFKAADFKMKSYFMYASA